MLHLAITKSTTTKTTTAHPYILKKNVTKKYNITHPLKMLYSPITKSTTTTNNPPLFTQMSYLAITKKDNITHPLTNVVFGYYQKYNITHPLKMLHLVITKSTTTTPYYSNVTKSTT